MSISFELDLTPMQQALEEGVSDALEAAAEAFVTEGNSAIGSAGGMARVSLEAEKVSDTEWVINALGDFSSGVPTPVMAQVGTPLLAETRNIQLARARQIAQQGRVLIPLRKIEVTGIEAPRISSDAILGALGNSPTSEALDAFGAVFLTRMREATS